MNQIVATQAGQPPEPTQRWTYRGPEDRNAQGGDGASVVDVGRLLLAIRRRWWLIGTCVVLAGASAWYAVDRRVPAYVATAVAQLVNSRDAVTSGLLKTDADVTPPDVATLSEIEILRSRAVAAAVVDSEPLGLRATTAGFPAAFLSDLRLDSAVSTGSLRLTFTPQGVSAGSPGGRPVPYGMPLSVAGYHFSVLRAPPGSLTGSIVVRSRGAAIEQVMANLNATPRPQTTIIDIQYTAADPTTAQNVVNRAARVYQAANTRAAQQQLHRRRTFDEDQIKRMESQLGDADRALSVFRNQQHAYSAQERFNAEQSGLVALDARRQELDGDRKMAQALLQKFQTGNATERQTALSMIAFAPTVGGTESAVADLYRRLTDYVKSRAELTSGPAGKAATHPDVQRLDTLIASTQADIIATAQANVAVLDARIQALDEARAENAASLDQIPAAEATQTLLQQKADALRPQVATLLADYQQAGIAEAAEVGNVEIVDFAAGALLVQRHRIRIILLGLMIGILTGLAAAILLETMDRAIKGRGDVESLLRLPVLATIPRLDTASRSRSFWRFVQPSGGKESDAVRQHVAVSTVTQSRSPSTEAFRQLRTNLAYSRTGDPGRRILVTSPMEGDGKTSVATNLAITMAQQLHRVLLIDADVYGRLHRVFQLPLSPGLSDVVLDGASPTEVLRTTSVHGLTVITAGQSRGGAPDIIGSDRMRAMLSDLSRDFDAVILDCSPILALADATLLSVSADAVVVVVRAGSTPAAAAIEAMRHLAAVGAPVAGVVLNDPESRAREYGSYYYGYRYAQG